MFRGLGVYVSGLRFRVWGSGFGVQFRPQDRMVLASMNTPSGSFKGSGGAGFQIFRVEEPNFRARAHYCS